MSLDDAFALARVLGRLQINEALRSRCHRRSSAVALMLDDGEIGGASPDPADGELVDLARRDGREPVVSRADRSLRSAWRREVLATLPCGRRRSTSSRGCCCRCGKRLPNERPGSIACDRRRRTHHRPRFGRLGCNRDCDGYADTFARSGPAPDRSWANPTPRPRARPNVR